MPGINDGANLIKTIEDLYNFYPGLNSLTIVPVGLTKHRAGLPKINTVTQAYAKMMLAQSDALLERFKINLNHLLLS